MPHITGGVTIIDNTVPHSPILEYRPPPVFKTDVDRQRYYEKEKVKWIEGYNEIPGTLYHKTMMQQIKNRNSGVTERPVCRDVDLYIHQKIRDLKKAEMAACIIKGRGIGLSTDMGCLANYYMRVHPGTTSLMTSSNQSKVSALFSDKFMFTYNKYVPEFIPPIIRKNETKNNVYLKAQIKYKTADGGEGYDDSEIYCLETADNDDSAAAFSGKGCIIGLFDELYLHKRRVKLLRSSSSCFIEQATGKVVAFLLAGGTCEDTLSNEEIGMLQKMIQDLQKSKTLGTIPAELIFLTALWGKFMTNGHTDFKKAQEWHDKEVERLGKLEDQSILRAFKMNNPCSLDDIFELEGGGMYSDRATEKIKVQLRRVTEERVPQLKYKVVEMNDGFEVFPDKKGKITIHEHPKKGVEYYLNIDGVGSGTEASGEEGSKVAGLIMKTFDPHPVTVTSYGVCAKYFERPSSVEQSYVHLTDLAKYFNKYDGFKGFSVEANIGTSDHFSTFLYKIGMKKFIIKRKDLSGKGNTNKKGFWQYIGGGELSYQIRQASPFLERYAEGINDEEVLRQLLLPKNVNADLRSAFHMFMIALPPDFDKPIEKKKDYTRTITVMQNGPNGWHWVDKEIPVKK